MDNQKTGRELRQLRNTVKARVKTARSEFIKDNLEKYKDDAKDSARK